VSLRGQVHVVPVLQRVLAEPAALGAEVVLQGKTGGMEAAGTRAPAPPAYPA
jgi:hypothetical protein